MDENDILIRDEHCVKATLRLLEPREEKLSLKQGVCKLVMILRLNNDTHRSLYTMKSSERSIEIGATVGTAIT